MDKSGQRAFFGVAGLNCPSVISSARAGIAGNLNREQREAIAPYPGNGRRIGDRAASVAWQYGVYFLDYTYAVCTDDNGKGDVLRWRRGREKVFGERRGLPLYLDSAAYRMWTGKTPKWAGLDAYTKAIDLCCPNGYVMLDVIGNQEASLANFKRMEALGYTVETGCIPSYQVGPMWDDGRSVRDNARYVARFDQTLHYYAYRSKLIGLGGMVKGPIPRDQRHVYIHELCRQFPDHQFWALGQANFKVVNGLGRMGLLDRVWTDGTWWILDAACERFAVVEDGQLKMLTLGASRDRTIQSFFTTTEMMAANLRSLLSAYAGLWSWPPPDPVPSDLVDVDQRTELKARYHQAQLELFGEGEVRLYGNVPVRMEVT